MVISEKETLINALDDHRIVLEEIAYGNEWGGPAEDHISYMRHIAEDLLENGSTKDVIK